MTNGTSKLVMVGRALLAFGVATLLAAAVLGTFQGWAHKACWVTAAGGGAAVLLSVVIAPQWYLSLVVSRQARYGTNVAIMVVAGMALLVMASYVNMRHYVRKDYTATGQFSLSVRGRDVLQNLKEEVKITAIFRLGGRLADPDARFIYDRFQKLLVEIKTVTSLVKVADLDPDRDRNEIEALVRRLNIVTGEQRALINSLVVEYKGRYKHVPYTDMKEMAMNPYQREPGPPKFKGEQAIVGAILFLQEEKKRIIYYTAGQGEGSLDDTDEEQGFSELGKFLRQQNFEIKKWNAVTERSAPKDCDVLMVLNPVKAFPGPVVDAVSAYMDAGGRVLTLMSVTADSNGSNLKGLFEKWGIALNEDRLAVVSGMDMLGRKVLTSNFGLPQLENHDITRKMQDVSVSFFFPCVVAPLEKAPEDVTVRALAKTPAEVEAWGESNLQDLKNVRFNEGQDIKGPLTLAVTAERASTGEQKGGRLVVVGDGNFVSNRASRAAPAGNWDLVLNSAHWLTERKELISIAAKEIDWRKPNLTPEEKVVWSKMTAWIALGALPLLALALGGAVWFVRRK
ncbi:MAG: Gldg family protein [Planctomycetota bacterium]